MWGNACAADRRRRWWNAIMFSSSSSYRCGDGQLNTLQSTATTAAFSCLTPCPRRATELRSRITVLRFPPSYVVGHVTAFWPGTLNTALSAALLCSLFFVACIQGIKGLLCFSGEA
ncbi:hypothetical protein SUGI_0224290 [Cryptomeria japonica]|nr:hypothetical protein SUGI_0224290 [Cryptomeria japonica]